MFPLGTSIVRQRFAVISWLLIALNVVAFGYQLFLPDEIYGAWMYEHGVVPKRQWQALFSEPWSWRLWLLPLGTSMFLHGGFLHIIGNMLFLFTFGPGVEERLGSLRFLGFYLTCGVIAALAQTISAPGSNVPMVGASGAVAGVLGAFLILYPKALVVLLVPILFIPFTFTVPALLFLVFWFGQQALFAWAELSSPVENEGGVAWWAHIGGFVAGFIGVFIVRRPPQPEVKTDAEVEVIGPDGRLRRYNVKRHPSRFGMPVPKRWER